MANEAVIRAVLDEVLSEYDDSLSADAYDELVSRLATPQAPAAAPAVDDIPGDSTNLEVVQHFIRVCREMKPVGQWPGERVCRAIELLLTTPRDFIAPEDRSPRRGHNGRGGDADQMTSPLTTPAASGGAAVEVEAVGVLRKDDDGDGYIEWLLEGGSAAMVGGEMLCVLSNDRLTHENGHVTLYTAPQQAAQVAETMAMGEAFLNTRPYGHDQGVFACEVRERAKAMLAAAPSP